METLSLTISVIYLAISTYMMFKFSEVTKPIYGKYNTLVYVLGLILTIVYFYVIHFHAECYIYNSISTVICLISSYYAIKNLQSIVNN